MTTTDAVKLALQKVLTYLAEEEKHYEADPAREKRRHVWNDVQKLLLHKGRIVRALQHHDALVEALDYLLEQTVDMDLKYGIALSEGQEDARAKALAAIARATGEDA